MMKLCDLTLQEPLLKYRLPAVACPPPLLLQVTPILPSETGGQKKSMLFVVQYCVNPKLSGALRDLTMTLQLPKPLGQPTKVGQRYVIVLNCVVHLLWLSRLRCFTLQSTCCVWDGM